MYNSLFMSTVQSLLYIYNPFEMFKITLLHLSFVSSTSLPLSIQFCFYINISSYMISVLL